MKYVSFPGTTGLYGERRTVDRVIRRMKEDRNDKFIPIITRYQGGPRSILIRLVHGDNPFQFARGVKVLFPAHGMPNPRNIGNQHAIGHLLKSADTRMLLTCT